LATNFQRKKEQFDTIFSAEAHETLRKRGLRRFSLKALQVKVTKGKLISEENFEELMESRNF
jgi:hypothetical protein